MFEAARKPGRSSLTLLVIMASLVASNAASRAYAQEGDTSQTEEEAREEDIFGSEETSLPDSGSSTLAPEDASPAPLADSTDTTTLKMYERLAAADQELAMGGFMFLSLQGTIPKGGDLDATRLAAPNLVDLFLDARPSPRVRAYIQGRLRYDYTVSAEPAGPPLAPGQMPGAGSSFALVGQAEPLRAQLDQLWLKFDLGRTVYVTLGRQRVRWGASRFWNPTDFLNTARLDPLAIFDQRLGVDLLKLHLPIEQLGWNFYIVGLLGQAGRPKDVGVALRGEFLFGIAEVALSGVVRRQSAPGPQTFGVFEPQESWPKTAWPLRLGADLSTSFGPIEVRVESALSTRLPQPFYEGEFSPSLQNLQIPRDVSRETSWFLQTSGGGDVQIDLNEEDRLILGAEYFYNQLGVKGSDLYVWLALQGALTPLYLGRHYVAASAILVGPGSWNDTSWTLSGIGNLSDGSFLTRVDASVLWLGEVRANVFGSLGFGEQGEFFFGVDVPEIAGQGGFSVAPTRWILGGALRVSF